MSEKWVTAWGNAISVAERRPENYAKNLTLRYPAKMMLDGSALRITLDNFCGNEPVHLTGATVAVSDGADGILPETLVPLTFSGNAGVTIPAGERLQSDAAAFPVEKGTTIAVSLYFAEFMEMRSGVVITGPLSGGYFAVGDQTANAVLDTDTSKKTHTVYFLSDIDVLTVTENRTLICFGDSITAQAWPDYLMERTLQCGDGTTAVIRKAASGTRILRQYDNITYDSYGLKGETRFPREIQVAGADTVLIQHGINDIIHPVGTDVNLLPVNLKSVVFRCSDRLYPSDIFRIGKHPRLLVNARHRGKNGGFSTLFDTVSAGLTAPCPYGHSGGCRKVPSRGS